MKSDINDSTSVSFGGVWFKGTRKEHILPEQGKFKFVVTANADFIVNAWSDRRLREIISKNYSTFDGQITWWLGCLLGRPRGRKIEKISGSSFAHDLLVCAAVEKQRVFFLGGEAEVNATAVSVSHAQHGVDVQGYSPEYERYPASAAWNQKILDEISSHRPHILLVALGSPKQEYWIDDNKEILAEMGVQLAIGCGGTLDFLAGRFPRAPLWIQRIGMEGVFRLFVQPSAFRLKRLMRSLLVFPIAAIRYFGPMLPR
jgi:N-acetylglucosaminyldiphosphoundecaprenol N-acetyl-beta-D-mannosaminyltransferase